MMNRTEEEMIQVTKEDALAQIELGKALDRLHRNKDFKKLIVECYQVKYAARQVSLLADPSANKQEVHAGLQGIAELLSFFRSVEHGALIAQRTYNEHVELEANEIEGDE